MNRDPFLRLALIAAVSVWLAGLIVFGIYFGAIRAALVAGVSVLLAGLLTYERMPGFDEPVEDLRQRRRQPAEGTRGFERIE